MYSYKDDQFDLCFYNIPFTDDRHSLLVGEVSDQFIDASNHNILTDFFMLKSKMVCTPKENTIIWVPCMNIKYSKTFNKLHYLEDVKISLGTSKYCAANFNEYCDLAITSDPDQKNNISIKPQPEDFMIRNNFLFAIINIDLANELNLSAIFVDLVKRENWKKAV